MVHAVRQARKAFNELRARLDVARKVYGAAREEGIARVSAGLSALRAAAGKDRGAEPEREGAKGLRARLARIVGRERPEREAAAAEREGRDGGRKRLREALGRGRDTEDAGDARDEGRLSIRERLEEVLGRARVVPERKDERRPARDRDRDEGYGL